MLLTQLYSNKKLLIKGILLIVLLPSLLIEIAANKRAGFFIGEIEYAYMYESNIINIDSLKQIKPVKSFFSYDLSNYQSKFFAKDTITYLYCGKFNKCLSQMNTNSNYDCEDYGIATDSIINWKVYDTDELILGHRCKVIEFQTKYSWNRYYVSRETKIAPDTYQKHLAYNWSFYGHKAEGGIILKLEHRFKKYTMKGVATNIVWKDKSFKAMNIPEETFLKICKQDK